MIHMSKGLIIISLKFSELIGYPESLVIGMMQVYASELIASLVIIQKRFVLVWVYERWLQLTTLFYFSDFKASLIFLYLIICMYLRECHWV